LELLVVNVKSVVWLCIAAAAIGGGSWFLYENSQKETVKTIEPIAEEKSPETKKETVIKEEKQSTESSLQKSSSQKTLDEKETPKEKSKTKEESKEASDATESLNKKTGKVLVKFKDGETITESEINADMEKIPDQLSEKMSLRDIKLLLVLRAAFDRVMLRGAQKEGIDKDPQIQAEIGKKETTIAGMILLNEKAEELMTDEALEKHYNEIWETNFKGTKEYSLKVITTSDKALADKISKTVKDEKGLNQLIEANKANLKAMDLNNRPESMLPAEVIKPIKTKGEKSIIGPFSVKDVFMLFFVKKVAEAKKHEFSGKFKEEYKKVAMPDFMQKVSVNLYKENNVKFLDINGKEIDIEAHSKKIKERAKDNTPPAEQFNIGKLNDDTVMAYINNKPVVASEIKAFFKLKSLQDEALLMMAHQFNMSLGEILVYATKLVVDDKLLTIEVEAIHYLSKPEVKEKTADVAKSEIARGFLKKHITVSPEQVRKTFNTVLKSIPEEDKNDHEIAVKMIFFASQEEAGQVLESINSGKAKFNDIFKGREASDKSAVDLKYVTKKMVPTTIWAALKRSATGVCHKEVVEIDGSKFGLEGKDYAIIYVADRRPLTLPSLSNPADKRYFEAMAYHELAVEFVISLFNASVISIFDKSVSDIISSPVAKKMIEAMVAGNV
jgi:hypothetical protein